jgi:hypothetical protein
VAFGSVGKRFEALRAERDAVDTALRSVVREAQEMLADLGEGIGAGSRPRQHVARKRRRRLSAQGRANIVAAAKKRWARERANKGKK